MIMRLPRRNRTSGLALMGLALGLSLAAAGRGASPAQDRGRAVATRSGCLSCHGAGLAGRQIISDPTIASLWSSNLSRVASRYSDRQLETTIRTGVRPDGTHLWFMAAPYAHLSPRDMADLIAFIRSLPPRDEDHGRIHMGPRFLKAVRAGRLQPEAIEQARDPVVPPDLGAGHARGRYLARTICAGCHYPSLDGLPDGREGDPPNLAVAAAYDRDAFRTLLRTGKGIGGRDLGVMSEESPKRFAGLSDADIDAIRAYLVARAATLPPAATLRR